MTLVIDRRSLLATGLLGLGAFALPGFAQTATVAGARGFTHNVASGEPGPDSMLLWTRYVPADGGWARLVAEVSATPDFARVVAHGEYVTGGWRDWTAKITVTGLTPGTRYFYRFVAPDGSRSPVGRTKTLPDGNAARFRAAIFSCSNLAYGYFNAYAHAVAGDFDCSIHLGDYFYEYAPKGYASDEAALAARVAGILPASEIIRLADYRLRFASYRADPDLAALHAAMPMIAQWDDHESANDSWEGGAENHDPKTEGDWGARKAASMQAYREWMPVSDEPWATYDIGDLATFFRTDMRLAGRSAQHSLYTLEQGGGDVVARLKAFRDGAWRDPAATMLGSTQEAWLAHALAASVRSGRRWQIVQSGTLVGNLNNPLDAMSWLAPDANAGTRGYIEEGTLAAQAGLPNNLDSWGGYPAARARLLGSAQGTGANLVVISGDSHNAWAFDLGNDGRPAGVEFGGTSVTSPGYESALGIAPSAVAAGLVRASPELKWCDASRRGYMALTVEPEHVRNDWVMVDTVKARSRRAAVVHSASVARGRGVMAA